MSASSAIYFCGGEPTIRKDLPELLEYSTNLNMFNMINTNGSLIGDLLLKPGYENFLYNMDVVIVSLDSLCVPKLADMYEVSEKVSRNVLRNLLALQILQKHIPFNLAANTVITKDTIEDTFDILDFCNDLGIKFSPIAANIGHEPDWDLLNNPRYRELVDKIVERSAKYPMIASGNMLKSILLPTKMTCYPTVFDHVDYDGGVFWPCKAYVKGIKPNIFDYDSIIDLHRAASQIINPKDFHGDGENQCKGHCQWMQDCVTSFYGKALKEGFRRSGVLKEILGLIK
jgi:MoaA/NifB/PqqE/SkfB family radical SAM enzyme